MADYKQYSSAYYGLYYAGDPFAASACGVCSLADLLNKDPVEIANWLTNNGYASNGQGTYWSGINACLTAYGANGVMIAQSLNGQMSSPYFEQWKNHIKSGYMGILLMHRVISNYWTNGGHFIAITSYRASDDKYYVCDPASEARTGWHSFSDFAGNICCLYTSSIKWTNTATPAGNSISSASNSSYSLGIKEVKIGSTGALVLLLQSILYSRGYYNKKLGLDGSYGKGTENAVRAYQRDRNKQGTAIAVDGICGARTWADLLGMSGTTVSLKQIKAGDQGLEVLLLQEIAMAHGYYNGALDRSYGKGTIQAVKLLQKKYGLGQDGVCGPKTWKAILSATKI